jgi:hypothetical protein
MTKQQGGANQPQLKVAALSELIDGGVLQISCLHKWLQ